MNLVFFRVAREYHQALYRAMVEALKGTANLSITGRPKDKSCIVYYQRGNESSKEIHKIKVKGCKKAWKYSEPKICERPIISEENDFKIPPCNNYLNVFYDLLAMIQTLCFMGMYDGSTTVVVSDYELKALEWLHEEIRNEYEHFVPKSYSSPIPDLIYVSLICNRLISELIFKSRNVISKLIPDKLSTVLEKSHSILKFYETEMKDHFPND